MFSCIHLTSHIVPLAKTLSNSIKEINVPVTTVGDTIKKSTVCGTAGTFWMQPQMEGGNC